MEYNWDFIVDMAFQIGSIPAIAISPILWTTMDSFGILLCFGILREAYNKLRKDKVYWDKQRKLWSKTN